MTSIILMGGSSTRLGRDKAMEVLSGLSLLDRVINKMTQISNEVLLVMKPNQYRDLNLRSSSVNIIYDDPLGNGPLGGLFSGLKASSSEYAWVVGCDMPFLNIELLKYQMQFASKYDAVVPKFDQLQALHAVYGRSCIPVIQKMFKQNKNHAIQSLFPLVNVLYLEKSDILNYDHNGESFFNVNTEDDLELALYNLEEDSKDKHI